MKLYFQSYIFLQEIAFIIIISFIGMFLGTKYIYFLEKKNKNRVVFMHLHCRLNISVVNQFVRNSFLIDTVLSSSCLGASQTLLEYSIIN